MGVGQSNASAGFEDGGKGIQAKEREQLLEAEKEKKTDSPPEPLEWSTALLTL